MPCALAGLRDFKAWKVKCPPKIRHTSDADLNAHVRAQAVPQEWVKTFPVPRRLRYLRFLICCLISRFAAAGPLRAFGLNFLPRTSL